MVKEEVYGKEGNYMIHLTMESFIIICIGCTAMGISIGTLLSIFARLFNK